MAFGLATSRADAGRWISRDGLEELGVLDIAAACLCVAERPISSTDGLRGLGREAVGRACEPCSNDLPVGPTGDGDLEDAGEVIVPVEIMGGRVG